MSQLADAQPKLVSRQIFGALRQARGARPTGGSIRLSVNEKPQLSKVQLFKARGRLISVGSIWSYTIEEDRRSLWEYLIAATHPNVS